MSAFDDAFHILEDSRPKRVWRDVRLALWLMKFFIGYCTVGYRIRRRFERKKRAGQPFWVD